LGLKTIKNYEQDQLLFGSPYIEFLKLIKLNFPASLAKKAKKQKRSLNEPEPEIAADCAYFASAKYQEASRDEQSEN